MATSNTVSNNSAATAAAMAVSSPRHAGDSVSSPQSRRGTKSGTPPWTQIVRGESEPIAAVPSSPSAASSTAVIEPVVAAASSSSTPSASSSPTPVEESVGESSDNGSGLNGNAGKRPAWNKPSNGAAEVGPVMGAVSWPPLSESTRASTKSSSPESSKGSLDGSSSVSVPQGTGTTITPPQKQPNPASTPNHTAMTRQRSMKRNNANAPSNGGNPHQQPSASHAVEMSPNNPYPKDNTQRSGFGSQTHSGGDHPQQRNSFRRNGGSHPRGDGSHHHNYGSRRDHDRGNQDWNSPRNFNGRDSHMHRGVPRFRNPAPPVSSTPFITPQPVPPFGGPMSFAELAPPVIYVTPPPESLRMPFIAPMSPFYLAPPDHQLHSKIVSQIDYYFSNENLIKDTYLRQNMDDQGWVPIKLIAGFNKVMNLTENIQIILDAVRISTVVEVQGDKVRRRNDWMRWIMPPVQFPNVQSPQTPGMSSHDILATHVQNIALEEKNTSHSSVRAGYTCRMNTERLWKPWTGPCLSESARRNKNDAYAAMMVLERYFFTSGDATEIVLPKNVDLQEKILKGPPEDIYFFP